MMPAPLADLLIALRFFSRLPLPTTAREITLGAGGLAEAIAMTPLAGAIIGTVAAIVLLAAFALGPPPLIAAPLAILALVALTGALHEDGLADCADGFGGGATREDKLAIMRDSRVGTYGACAVALSLYLRAACLTVLLARDPARAVAALVAGAALSRVLCLTPMMLLPPARGDGAGAAAVGLGKARFAAACVIGLAIACLPVFANVPPPQVALACVIAVAVAVGVCALAWRQIGGQTGDVAGATQQAVEIAFLIVHAG
jgi:adenosylcobinamide-GDP ribazoletransferase